MDTKAFAAQFADWLEKSAAAHENSYDQEGADAAQEKSLAEYEREKEAGNPQFYMYGAVDYKQFYRMTMYEAVESVVPAEFVQPVYLLLVNSWNDINDWAKEHRS